MSKPTRYLENQFPEEKTEVPVVSREFKDAREGLLDGLHEVLAGLAPLRAFPDKDDHAGVKKLAGSCFDTLVQILDCQFGASFNQLV